ncbi:MAG: TIGR04282 family arsenosugar biosynthesis glycosyltransferase [Flavobacteriales bacterium]|nr:TIGR04282 family arsenosugar biosynthesis glycosyltransferase [Flavobacteriales bacterium]
MKKKALIVFVKNIRLGKVKTRLAKTVGDEAAFEVYKHLVGITEKESQSVPNVDRLIYFSDVIIDTKWAGDTKYVQEGADLGERMKRAFQMAFDKGYDQVVGIGSDLPDLNKAVIELAFEKLNEKETVFGPAEDGGYYLLGMNELIPTIFENKSWSTSGLLEETLTDLNEQNRSVVLLKTLNDIDTIEDLKASSISNKFKELYELSRSDKSTV